MTTLQNKINLHIWDAPGNQQTERDVVEEALREYVQRRKQLRVLELFGTIEYEADDNYKQQRQQS